MRQMGPGHFRQRIFGIDLYHDGPEPFEATQGLLLRKKIEDASGQHKLTVHFSDEESAEIERQPELALFK